MDFPAEPLRALAAVVDTGSFEAAARKLRITPSAVSQRIRSLERQAGTVVVRRSIPAEPTPAGEVLVRLARQVQLVADQAIQELAVVRGGGEGPASRTRTPVTIVVPADSLASWFAPVLDAAADEDGLTLQIIRADENESAQLLRSGRAMGAVTTQATPVQGCSATYLGALRYRAMASPEFAARWFGTGKPLAEGLALAPVLQFDTADPLQNEVLAHHLAEGNSRPPEHFVPDSVQFARAAAAGLGWAMIPQEQAAEINAAGVRLVPVGDIVRDVHLHWQRWTLHSEALDWVSGAVAYAARKLSVPA